MDDQEQQNQNDGFIKSQLHKGKNALKDEARKKSKEATKKIIIKILSNPITWKILLIIILFITVIILLSGFVKIIFNDGEDDVNDASETAISTNYAGSNSTVQTNVNGSTVNRVVINSNASNNGYEITYNNTPEHLENVKQKLEKDKVVESTSNFTEIELAVMGALMESGADLDYYTDEQLKCFPQFIKAEASTQNFDLRPNSEKIINGEYVPQKIEDLAENEVPGTILVQRTNTNSTTPNILEHKVLTEFENMINNDDPNAMNYFSITEDGKLIIAKWENVFISVTGNYPENLDESEKDTPTGAQGEYSIEPERIEYSQYIQKYTMPFEFLVQLLVITEEPDFCKELVDYVLDSKIVINIQEKEKITEVNEEKIYTVHSKDNKYLDYNINVAGQPIFSNDVREHFIKYAMDDEELAKESGENNCTSYDKNDFNVNVYKKYTNHSYVLEVIEVDNWIAKYKKTYAKKDPITQPTTTNTIDVQGENYEQIDTKLYVKDEDINRYWNVFTFKNEIRDNYEPLIIVPESIIISEVMTDQYGINYKLLKIKYKNGTIVEHTKCYEIIDEEGNATGEYLPSSVTIKTNTVSATDKTAQIPRISYIFELNSDGSAYQLQTDIDPLVECIVSKLKIDNFEKIDLNNTVKTTVTEYPVDENPITESDIYSVDDDGNFEKFLLALDNNEEAKASLNSIDSWLYEMMEERQATVDFVNIIKYLLYLYDGEDRGVTDESNMNELFSLDKFVRLSSGGIIVKTNAEGAVQELSKEKIEEIIEKRFSGKQKENLLSALDGIMYIQDEYNVNPVFAIAVAQKETNCGENLPVGSYNLCNMDTTEEYESYDEAIRDFGAIVLNDVFVFNKYTINSIADRYYNDSTDGWVRDVSKFVKEMYESIGETVYSTEGNELQQKVVEVATNSEQYGITAVKGRCQAWVCKVYKAAGVNDLSSCCATHAGQVWGASSDWSQIQLGAAVYGYANQQYGHVGIYVGDGLVAHNVGGVAYDDLNDWITQYKGICWGWNGGTDLTGGLYPSIGGFMTANHAYGK